MSDEINPYAAQSHAPEQPMVSSEPLPGESGMVNQVLVVCILQIVQGALELLMSLMVMAPIAVFTLAEDIDVEEAEFWIMCLIYGGLSALALSSAIFRIVTGIRALKFKGRMPLVISLGFGLLTSVTCYCGPTSIALAVYGLIVTLSPGVIKAFRMAAEGVSPSEIRRRFQNANWVAQPYSHPNQPYAGPPEAGAPGQPPAYPTAANPQSPNPLSPGAARSNPINPEPINPETGHPGFPPEQPPQSPPPPHEES